MTTHSNQSNKHAIVIGGSIAGMLTARVLSNHFDRVTVIERDALNDGPEARKGQPQARHLHALLAGGLQTMTRYFPDLIHEFQRHGEAQGDLGEHIRWHIGSGYRQTVRTGLWSAIISRPFLEWQIRRRVEALRNVEVRSGGNVESLLADETRQRVTGVQVMWRKDGQREAMNADLVIDTSGRGSHTPKWLAALGYDAAPEGVVTCKITYATCLFSRQPNDPLGDKYVMVTPPASDTLKRAGAFPLEGDRWQVTLVGVHGEPMPIDGDAFMAFAKSLPTLDVYNIVANNEPLTDIMHHKFPSNLRRFYEKLTRFPTGYLVLGDAVCSFNPIFGQGMTSAAMQAHALDELLHEMGVERLDGLARRYFRSVAKVVDIPWKTAAREDFRYKDTTGDKQLGTDLLNAYSSALHRATVNDAVVCEAFMRVVNMVDSPAILFRPQILWRVLRSELHRKLRGRSQRSVETSQFTVDQPADTVR
ncbi:MAG: FAD-dependent monooxygenase [Chloroflexales bacterium]|nr:FAD-dependent monooxygenase [Chloroflexales bacterium]